MSRYFSDPGCRWFIVVHDYLVFISCAEVDGESRTWVSTMLDKGKMTAYIYVVSANVLIENF